MKIGFYRMYVTSYVYNGILMNTKHCVQKTRKPEIVKKVTLCTPGCKECRGHNSENEQSLGRAPTQEEIFRRTHVNKKTINSEPGVLVEQRAEDSMAEKGRFNLLAMATVRVFFFTFLFAVLFVQQCICTDPPSSSPTPAPESGADVASPPVTPPAPSPSSNLTSPPAPPPSDLHADSTPAPSPGNAAKESPSPAPNSEVASDISHESAEESKESSGGGMTSGKKAGIAVGVIAAVCFVGLGALVYKKRQQNIQRTQFGYDARREIL